MVGKIIRILLLACLSVLIFCGASIAGVRNDEKKAKLAAQESEESKKSEEAEAPPVTSPYEAYTGGKLDMQMDYEVHATGSDVVVSVVTNLPDGYDLTAELSNVEDVKQRLGFAEISSSALTPEQMNSINEQTYSQRDKNFVKDGVCNFAFKDPPPGQLDLQITSPITKLQPPAVQELLGEKGVNLQGNYVVFLEEVADKSINFTASFIVQDVEATE